MAIELKGGDKLAAKLKALPNKVAKRFMARALKSGAQEIAASVIASAPVKTGELVASVNIKTSNSGSGTSAKVGAVFYATFLNNGTKGRPIEGGRRNKKHIDKAGLTGAIQATHFMTKAAEQASPDAVQATASKLREDIESDMSK